jgi:hypothetical protein
VKTLFFPIQSDGMKGASMSSAAAISHSRQWGDAKKDDCICVPKTSHCKQIYKCGTVKIKRKAPYRLEHTT